QLSVTVKGVLPFFEPLREDDPDASNPLTLALEQSQMDLKGLYKGGIGGQVVVKGAALRPVIGGEVRFTNGQVFIPQWGAGGRKASGALDKWRGTATRNAGVAIVPQLDNFRVVLKGLEIGQRLYKFRFGGALTLNGTLDNLNNLQPEGAIQLERGQVTYAIRGTLIDTGGKLLSPNTQFVLNRRHNNQLVFYPERGLLNPELDIQMRTLVSDFRKRLPELSQTNQQTSEIPDDPLSRIQRINILLSIKGQVSQLLPSLGKQASEACQIRPDTIQPIPETEGFSKEELQKLEACIKAIAFESKSDSESLNPSIVNLTSNPPRSKGEIIRLLGEQIFVVVEGLQNRGQEQVFNSGAIQLLVPLLAQNIVSDVENTVGKALGLADFRFSPIVEMSLKVGDQSFVNLSYDYNPDFNEFKVRYQIGF
ncbi:MAG: translocation/assembly module TamB domain-containing protein, partial [Xenococcaceae cyanobacterium]